MLYDGWLCEAVPNRCKVPNNTYRLIGRISCLEQSQNSVVHKKWKRERLGTLVLNSKKAVTMVFLDEKNLMQTPFAQLLYCHWLWGFKLMRCLFRQNFEKCVDSRVPFDLQQG